MRNRYKSRLTEGNFNDIFNMLFADDSIDLKNLNFECSSDTEARKAIIKYFRASGRPEFATKLSGKTYGLHLVGKALCDEIGTVAWTDPTTGTIYIYNKAFETDTGLALPALLIMHEMLHNELNHIAREVAAFGFKLSRGSAFAALANISEDLELSLYYNEQENTLGDGNIIIEGFQQFGILLYEKFKKEFNERQCNVDAGILIPDKIEGEVIDKVTHLAVKQAGGSRPVLFEDLMDIFRRALDNDKHALGQWFDPDNPAYHQEIDDSEQDDDDDDDDNNGPQPPQPPQQQTEDFITGHRILGHLGPDGKTFYDINGNRVEPHMDHVEEK